MQYSTRCYIKINNANQTICMRLWQPCFYVCRTSTYIVICQLTNFTYQSLLAVSSVCIQLLHLIIICYCRHRVLVPHIALTLSQSQDKTTLSAVHKLIETFVKQANNKNGKNLSVSYITGKSQSLQLLYVVIVHSNITVVSYIASQPKANYNG